MPMPSQRPTSADGLKGGRVPSGRTFGDVFDAAGPVTHARVAQQRPLPGLRLPAAPRSTSTLRPVGVDHHVPRLARISR